MAYNLPPLFPSSFLSIPPSLEFDGRRGLLDSEIECSLFQLCQISSDCVVYGNTLLYFLACLNSSYLIDLSSSPAKGSMLYEEGFISLKVRASLYHKPAYVALELLQ